MQERALRLITNDYQSSFNILHEFSIHQSNMQTLLIELYKITHQIAPPIMNSLFVFHEKLVPLKEKSDSGKVKFVYVRFASFTNQILVLFI